MMEMRFLDLRYFILFMWSLVMAACILFIFIIAPISKFQLIHYGNSLLFLSTSFIQALLAITIVGILIIVLNKFKRVYLFKKLQDKEKS